MLCGFVLSMHSLVLVMDIYQMRGQYSDLFSEISPILSGTQEPPFLVFLARKAGFPLQHCHYSWANEAKL